MWEEHVSRYKNLDLYLHLSIIFFKEVYLMYFLGILNENGNFTYSQADEK
jgi:hypothetical protein